MKFYHMNHKYKNLSFIMKCMNKKSINVLNKINKNRDLK